MAERNNGDNSTLRLDALRALNHLHVANREGGQIDVLELKRGLAVLANLPRGEFDKLIAYQKNGRPKAYPKVPQRQ